MLQAFERRVEKLEDAVVIGADRQQFERSR